jgi:hypothetical protein
MKRPAFFADLDLGSAHEEIKHAAAQVLPELQRRAERERLAKLGIDEKPAVPARPDGWKDRVHYEQALQIKTLREQLDSEREVHLRTVIRLKGENERLMREMTRLQKRLAEPTIERVTV